MPSPIEIPRVGVSALVFAGRNHILLGKRKGYGNGQWALPGGRLELKEKFAECAKRELFEETGLDIPLEHFHFFGVTNDVFEDGAHWVTVVYSVGLMNQVPVMVKEPDKCYEWRWFDLDPRGFNPIPDNLYLCFRNLLDIDRLGTGGESANGFSI